MPARIESNQSKTKTSKATRGPTRKQIVPTGIETTGLASGPAASIAAGFAHAPAGVRKPGPKRSHRTDITLPPTVVNAVEEHARVLGVKQTEYHCLAVAAYFRHVLLDPPATPKRKCGECGRDLRTTKDRSGFKRVRVGVRFDTATVAFITDLAENFFDMTWSRAFEAALRFFLGERNPPPEGFGKEPGVSRVAGRPKGSKNHSTKLKEKRLARVQKQIEAAEAAATQNT